MYEVRESRNHYFYLSGDTLNTFDISTKWYKDANIQIKRWLLDFDIESVRREKAIDDQDNYTWVFIVRYKSGKELTYKYNGESMERYIRTIRKTRRRKKKV